MKKIFKSLLCSSLSLLALSVVDNSYAKSVEVKTNGIRRVASALINGKPMVYVSEIDGAVSLNTLDGKQMWRVPSDNPAVVFKIISTDIDGDKSSDLLTVSANGSVYAFSSKGKLLWKYTTPEKVRLTQIATIGKGKDMRIFAGGNDYTLYELNAKGQQLSATKISGSVHSIVSGDFIEEGKEILFVYTLSHDKFRSDFFGFIDPKTKEILKKDKIEKSCNVGSFMVNDVTVADINEDGRDDILVTGHAKVGYTFVVDGELNNILTLKSSGRAQRYAHAFAESLIPVRKEIVMQYGGNIDVYDLKGKLIKSYGDAHQGIIYNDLECVKEAKILIGGGQIGGDNTLYTYDLTKTNWVSEEQQFGGLYKEVSDNINTLYNQTINFKKPSYQKKQDNKFTLLGVSESELDKRVAKLNECELIFLTGDGNFSENTSRDKMVAAIGKDALKVDKRRKYDDTREDIIAWAKKKEAAGEKFQLWVGHGTDPYILHIETIEEMLKVAPNTCCGLVYAEMDNTQDPRIQYFVNEYMPRLAKAIRDNNAQTKLYFRYKNMFWAADSHEPLWKKLFFSKEYKDLIVPSAEDTNNRLQDINFAGRVGMFMGGSIDDFAMRMVDDNPTSWRPYSPGGQRSVSPYLRTSALLAAYGSRHGLLFPIKYLEKPGYNAFYALLKSGVIPTVKPEDILSVGSFMLVDHVNEEYLSKVSNGHDLIRYSTDDANGVVSYAGVHWCGVDVPDYDYSKIASGVDYRWLNFLPSIPNGLVPITESEYAPTLKKKGIGYVETDIYQGIVNGKKVDAKSFGTTLEKSVKDGAKKLLMTVDGASWGLFRIDDKHARLIVVDPGFIDPARRDVTINLQNLIPTKATDILSGEVIKIKDNKINLSVPAGSMRFIDFEYSKPIK